MSFCLMEKDHRYENYGARKAEKLANIYLIAEHLTGSSDSLKDNGLWGGEQGAWLAIPTEEAKMKN